MESRSRRVSVAVTCIGLALRRYGGVARPDEGSARDLLKSVYESAPQVPFTAEVTLTAAGGERQLLLSHKRVGNRHATFMEVTQPDNLRDTRFLLFEQLEGADELYIYLPALRRIIPVRDDVRKQAFLGSDFYVYDLVAPDIDSYTHEYVGEEQVAGRQCKLIASAPKDATGELYSKVVFAVAPSERLIMRTEFFDPGGKLLKVWTLETVERVEGIQTPRLQKMVNVQHGTDSRLELTDVEYNADIEDEVFTQTHLKR
jgi:hypothetical protein